MIFNIKDAENKQHHGKVLMKDKATLYRVIIINMTHYCSVFHPPNHHQLVQHNKEHHKEVKSSFFYLNSYT